MPVPVQPELPRDAPYRAASSPSFGRKPSAAAPSLFPGAARQAVLLDRAIEAQPRPMRLQQLARLPFGNTQLARTIDAIENMRLTDDAPPWRAGQLPADAQRLARALGDICQGYQQLSESACVMAGEAGKMIDGLQQYERSLDDFLTQTSAVPANSLTRKIRGWAADSQAQLKDRIAYLKQTVAVHPWSASAMYETRAKWSEAALRVLDGLERKGVPPTALAAAKSALQARQAALRDAAANREGQLADPVAVNGRRLMTGLEILRHPLLAIEQREKRDAYASGLLGAGKAPGIDTPEVDERVIVEEVLRRVMKQANVPGSAGRELDRGMNGVLNDQPWLTIRNAIQLKRGKTVAVSVSEIRPGPQLFGSYGGKGVNAHSTAECRHAANLALTTLVEKGGGVLFQGVRHGVLSAFGLTPQEVSRMDDDELAPLVDDLLAPDGGLNVIDLRDAGTKRLVEPAFGPRGAPTQIGAAARERLQRVRGSPETVEAMRRVANQLRGLEVAKAHLLADPEALAKALAGAVPTVRFVSISLLTPDQFRSGPHDNERLMLADQRRALEDIKGECEVVVPDPATGETRRVKVVFEPIALNYGVNRGAIRGIVTDTPELDAISGWDVSDGLNSAGLRLLFGDLGPDGAVIGGLVGQALAERRGEVAYLRQMADIAAEEGNRNVQMRDNVPQALRRAAIALRQCEMLAAQVLQMHRDGSYKTGGQEPYKMASRLALLLQMLDVKVAFNCKSGKDRTGELDAEIKHLRLQMEMTGEVPDYGRDRTDEEKRDFFEVLSNSGNLEMQRLNTGYAGYKINDMPAVYAQFGGDRNGGLVDAFRGLSAYTQS